MFYSLKKKIMVKALNKRKLERPFNYESAESYTFDKSLGKDSINTYYFTGHDEKFSYYVRIAERLDHYEFWLYLELEGVSYYARENIVTSNPLTLTRDGDTYKIAYKGSLIDEDKKAHEVTFNGTFNGQSEPVDFTTSMPSIMMAKALAREKWSKELFKAQENLKQTHYEQVGSFKVEVKLDSKSYAYEVPSVRDHSFGLRDWDYMNNHLWIAALNRKGELNFSMVSYPCLSLLEVGNYYLNGKTSYVIDAQYDLEALLNKDLKSFFLTLYLDDKSTLKVEVEVTSYLDYPFKDSAYVLRENIANFKINGMTYKGIFETGLNKKESRHYNGKKIRKLKK